MREAGKFAVFWQSTEYHLTKEIAFTYHSSLRGKVKGASLTSLCGAHIGLIPYEGGTYASGKPMPCLYDEPPVGSLLCQHCARSLARRKGLARILSHLFHHWRGSRAGARALGWRM